MNFCGAETVECFRCIFYIESPQVAIAPSADDPAKEAMLIVIDVPPMAALFAALSKHAAAH